MSRGESLPGSVLGTLESHFGRSLGDVRVHTDPAAGEAARGIHARAFALGSHIYFAPGQFNPKTPAGLGLIGHEVAHVDQFHRGLSGLGTTHAKSLGMSIGSGRLERFADDHARRLAGAGVGAGGRAIESFSVRCVQQHGPAALRALERIAGGAVERAGRILDREHVSMTIDELTIEHDIDLADSEEVEIRRLAGKIANAARLFALRTSPGAHPFGGATIHLARQPREVGREVGTYLDELLEANPPFPKSDDKHALVERKRELAARPGRIDPDAINDLTSILERLRKANVRLKDRILLAESRLAKAEKELMVIGLIGRGEQTLDHLVKNVFSGLDVWVPDEAAANALIDELIGRVMASLDAGNAEDGLNYRDPERHLAGQEGPEQMHRNVWGKYNGKAFKSHVYIGDDHAAKEGRFAPEGQPP